MTEAVLTPFPRFRAFDANGDPLSGGKLYTYLAGSSTPKATYTTRAGTVANTNPVILNANGEADVWLVGRYKFILHDAADVVQWTVDHLGGDPEGAFPSGVVLAWNTVVVASENDAGVLLVPDLYPAGSIIEGVLAMVDTTFGNSNGLTALDLGDASSPSRWGRNIARVGGTETTIVNWEGYEPFPVRSATDGVITAVSGTFDATGQMTVHALYRTLASPL